MMLKKALIAAAFTASVVAAAPPASAQQATGGLVNVTIGNVTVGDVLSGFLSDVEITALNNVLNGNDVSVQLPIGLAANVCNVQANILAHGGTGGTCEAMNGSVGLAQAIRRQYLH